MKIFTKSEWKTIGNALRLLKVVEEHHNNMTEAGRVNTLIGRVSSNDNEQLSTRMDQLFVKPSVHDFQMEREVRAGNKTQSIKIIVEGDECTLNNIEIAVCDCVKRVSVLNGAIKKI